MRLTSSDLATDAQGGQFIRELAQIDQSSLWLAASRVRASDETLQSEAEAVGSAPEDATVVERIEQRHSKFEKAQAGHEKARQRAMLVGTLAAVAAAPATLFIPPVALGLLVITFLTVLHAVRSRRKMDKAARAETAALAEAGASSYLGFHLQRVNGLLSSGQSRRRLLAAAEAHRDAVADWHRLAGEAQVDWALEHREEILAAARLHKDVGIARLPVGHRAGARQRPGHRPRPRARRPAHRAAQARLARRELPAHPRRPVRRPRLQR